MRFKRLDLNLLFYLDALLVEKNVTRAAERSCISPSAMSHALARLREYFTDELLVQIGRQMVLTPLANELVRPVRDALLRIEAVTLIEPSFDVATSERTLTVMASDYSGNVLMPAAIRMAAEQAPHVRVHMRQMDNHWPEHIERGEVDMVLMARPFALDGHPQETLFGDTYVCIAWAENPLDAGTFSLAQYLQSGHVAVEYAAGRIPTLDERLLQHQKIVRRVETIVPNFSQLAPVVIGTRRLATIPARMARLFLPHLPLKVLPMPDSLQMPFHVVMQYHQYQALDPVMTWFRGLLKTAAGEMGDSAA